jgi:hypothetical protein
MDSPTAPDRAAYTYTPLEGGHIRLIDLGPALDSNAPIRFSFHKGQLSDLEARYEAISYTWGEPKLTYPLYFEDDTQVLVTENLDRALRRVRLPTSRRVLWADAICINQDDNDEKALQIPMMTHIFRGASRVLAWVGGCQEAQRGLQLLSLLSRTSASSLDTQLKNLYRDGINAVEKNSGIYLERLPIRNFLSLAWFTRLWVIQEIVFNPDVLLLCGTSEITWVRLLTALRVLQKTLIRTAEFIGKERIEALSIVGRLWELHSILNEPQAQNAEALGQDGILNLVERFCQYRCSDARDRIFAVYSMASGVRKTDSLINMYGALSADEQYVYIDIDYAADILQTYTAFSASCIKSGKATTILNAVLARQHTIGTNDWPSWVPDWRKTPCTPYVSLNIYRSDRDTSFVLASPNRLIVSFRNHWNFNYDALPTVINKYPIGDTLETFASSLYQIFCTCTNSTAGAIFMNLLSSEPWDNNAADVFVQDVLRCLDPKTNFTLSSLTASTRIKVQRLHQAMQHQCFLTVCPPNLPQYLETSNVCGGYGNAALRHGDRLAPYIPRRGCLRYVTALIIRPLNNTSTTYPVPYRLIGSACIHPPTGLGSRTKYDRETPNFVEVHLV